MRLTPAQYVGLGGQTITEEEWEQLRPLVHSAFLSHLSRERAIHWLNYPETFQRDLQNFIWEQFNLPHSVRY